MRVLETAVGTGANLLALDPGAEIFGFDHSAAMLRRCRSRLAAAGRSAGLVLADLAAAPFLDAVFDLVFHMGGLQFVEDPGQCIAEMHRVVKAGGRIVIIEESASASSLARRSRAGGLAEILPAEAKDIRIETISGGELLAIEFRK
jgi:ubiquinone/menaquinone biosynthesis C-methylase UbiE